MKKLSLITLTLLFFASLSFGQRGETYLWEYEGKNKTNTLGLYGGMSGTFTEVLDKPAGFLDAKVGLVFNQNWTIGIAAKGLAFDHTLNEVVNDGDYRLEAGYAGMYIEYLLPLGHHVKISLSLLSASGIALYRYDKEQVEGKEWYEEVIDQDRYGVLEPGAEILVRLGKKWWIGARADWRSISPLKLKDTDENILDGGETGVSLRYGIF